MATGFDPDDKNAALKGCSPATGQTMSGTPSDKDSDMELTNRTREY
jgi:hypothetical protein